MTEESPSTKSNQASGRRPKLMQSAIPAGSLDDAMRVARAVYSAAGTGAATPFEVAKQVDLTPGAGRWRELSGTAIAFGLVEGGAQADLMRLTALGRRAVAPTEEGDDVIALREAALRPTIVQSFLQRFERKKVPAADIAKNVLVDEMGVPRERADRALAMVLETGRRVGLLQEFKGAEWVSDLDGEPTLVRPLDDMTATPAMFPAILIEDEAPKAPDDVPVAEPRPASVPVRIFVGHGTRTAALEDLKAILTEFGIKFSVAADEAHQGRPISQKIAETMRACTAGVFVFTPDDVLQDADGNEVARPRENVIFELGAASLLYGNKIVIFKEKSVRFASDYQDLGYIEFEGDNLKSKAFELLRELMALGAVQLVTPAA